MKDSPSLAFAFSSFEMAENKMAELKEIFKGLTDWKIETIIA